MMTNATNNIFFRSVKTDLSGYRLLSYLYLS